MYKAFPSTLAGVLCYIFALFPYQAMPCCHSIHLCNALPPRLLRESLLLRWRLTSPAPDDGCGTRLGITTVLRADPASCCVHVQVDVPADAPLGAELRIPCVTVAGLRVGGPCGGDDQQAPVTLCARVCALAAPMRLACAARVGYHTPAIAADGCVYSPLDAAETVRVFAWDGAPLQPICVVPLGLTRHVKVVVACRGAAPADGDVLLLADEQPRGSTVAAVRQGSAPGPSSVIWRASGF